MLRAAWRLRPDPGSRRRPSGSCVRSTRWQHRSGLLYFQQSGNGPEGSRSFQIPQPQPLELKHSLVYGHLNSQTPADEIASPAGPGFQGTARAQTAAAGWLRDTSNPLRLQAASRSPILLTHKPPILRVLISGTLPSNFRMMTGARGSYLWLLLCLIAQAALLTHRLELLPMWGDELFTLYAANTTVPRMIDMVSGDVHPPLYFLLAHC